MILSKLSAYARLMRLNKPIGSYLLLWPTLMAVWLASNGHPTYSIVFIFSLGVLVMRSAGCVINDLADQKFDGFVARTHDRPLVSLQVSRKEAKALTLLLLIIAFILALQLNLFAILLSVVAVGFAVCYPFMKRYTHFPQVILGIAYSFSIPIAFAAIRNDIPLDALVLFLATVFWVVAYDTEYALMDLEDDLKIGVKSTAVFFKEKASCFIAIMQCLALVLWFLLGLFSHFGIFYFLGLLLGSSLFIWQHYLIKKALVPSYFKAFLNNNLLGALLFIGLSLDFMCN